MKDVKCSYCGTGLNVTKTYHITYKIDPCPKCRRETANEEYDRGQADGYIKGHDHAVKVAKEEHNENPTEYLQGLSEGFKKGRTQGYDQGFKKGRAEGYTEGHTDGTNKGCADGYDQGLKNGHVEGFNKGDDNGYVRGYKVGRAEGRAYGFDEGYKKCLSDLKKAISVKEEKND